MTLSAGKRQQRGTRSRALILDSAEHLMASRGYAGTSISAICKTTGLPATSLYHHFGNKAQLLAAVMERGAQRWFASLPDWTGPRRATAALVDEAADAVAENPSFLRLFYQLSLDSEIDPGAAELVQRVRANAFQSFHSALSALLAGDYPPDVAAAVATRLTPFAVALSDGCFFSLQLEPDKADVRRMFADLVTAVRALAPGIATRYLPTT